MKPVASVWNRCSTHSGPGGRLNTYSA